MWRLPTKEEWQELRDKCAWTWGECDGMNGFKVTGVNGYSIFLPAAGCLNGTLEFRICEGLHGYYFTSSHNAQDHKIFFAYFFGKTNQKWDTGRRCSKYSVRPVSDDNSCGVDLGLSVKWCSHNWRNSAETDIRKGDLYTIDKATKLFQNNNKMGNILSIDLNDNPILVVNGVRYKMKEGGSCGDTCALFGICNNDSRISNICGAMTRTGVSNFELMSDQFTDSSKMVENNRLRPDYYVINGIECKDVIGEFSYNIGAAIKYLWRHGRKTEEGMSDKDKAIEDLRKAVEHIQFEIERLSK